MATQHLLTARSKHRDSSRRATCWIRPARHRKVIRNDGQAFQGVPIELDPSDGEPPQQPKVLPGNPRSDVVGTGPPILSRGRRFKSCPRYEIQARNLRIPSLKAFSDLIKCPLTVQKHRVPVGTSRVA
jgi:hypothetical protein